MALLYRIGALLIGIVLGIVAGAVLTAMYIGLFFRVAATAVANVVRPARTARPTHA